jgi:hypothetical protein
MEFGRATACGLALVGALAAASCGGEPESANAQESTAEAPVVPRAIEQEDPEPGAIAAPEPAAAPERPTLTPAAPARAPRPIRPAQSAAGQGVVAAPESEDDPSVETSAGVSRSDAAARDVRALEAGRTLELSVEAELSTGATRIGDEFTATVRDDVLGSAGEVMLPMGTQFKGRVVDSRESTGADQPAVLTLAVESVTVNGVVRPLKATVVELDVEADARDSNTRTAAKVGVGAAAGALVGRILGRDRDATIKGAVVGAAAGTAAAIVSRDGHATVMPGARMLIRLDERLIVGG